MRLKQADVRMGQNGRARAMDRTCAWDKTDVRMEQADVRMKQNGRARATGRTCAWDKTDVPI